MTQLAPVMRSHSKLLVGRGLGPWTARKKGNSRAADFSDPSCEGSYEAPFGDLAVITLGHSKNGNEIIKQDISNIKHEGGAWHIVGTQYVFTYLRCALFSIRAQSSHDPGSSGHAVFAQSMFVSHCVQCPREHPVELPFTGPRCVVMMVLLFKD